MSDHDDLSDSAPCLCPICHETIGELTPENVIEEWATLPCTHRFGSYCIKRWMGLADEPVCPICRTPMLHFCGHPHLPLLDEEYRRNQEEADRQALTTKKQWIIQNPDTVVEEVEDGMDDMDNMDNTDDVDDVDVMDVMDDDDDDDDAVRDGKYSDGIDHHRQVTDDRNVSHDDTAVSSEGSSADTETDPWHLHTTDISILGLARQFSQDTPASLPAVAAAAAKQGTPKQVPLTMPRMRVDLDCACAFCEDEIWKISERRVLEIVSRFGHDKV